MKTVSTKLDNSDHTRLLDMCNDDSPLIIGGVGGSGTRVVCQIAIDAGFFMGTNLNISLDSLDFKPIYDYWIREFLNEPSVVNENKMKKAFTECLSKHLSTNKNMKWGFKNPRFILILQFLHSLYPKMKFMHVIRDGRDVAFSSNQNQPKLYGDIFCGNEPAGTPLYSLKYWSIINQNALNYGLSNLKNNYLIVRFEDIISKPIESIKKILEFLGSETNKITEIQEKIKNPSTIGRWQLKSNELSQMSKFEEDSLAKFGYF